MTSKEKAKEVLEHAAIYGDASAIDTFKVNAETLGRYRRLCPDARLKALAKLNANCTDDELNTLATCGPSTIQHREYTTFEGEEYIFAHATDLHFGHQCADDGWWESMIVELVRLKIKNMYLTGDITEGMSARQGHVYELVQPGGVGYKAQLETATKRLSMFPGDIYAIDGNHDRWFQKSNGAIIVEDICKQNAKWHFLGQDEGNHVVNGVEIRLWHGEDTSSYATSYRIQKLVESFTGGEKPAVLLLGHTHKMGYFIERNIHCISGGCMERQTKWMRGKRIAAHPGFWIVRLVIKDKEVKSCTGTFHPFYK